MILIFAFVGCKNRADESNKQKVVDTSHANIPIERKIVQKDKFGSSKTSQHDTIREYSSTQMSEDNFQKAVINLSDSSLMVYENIRADYRIFGYQKPDTNSLKMIFFSVFTTDVEDNPYQCTYGSYYSSSGMKDLEIKYVKHVGDFIEANLIKNKNELGLPIYFLKNWVEFEQ